MDSEQINKILDSAIVGPKANPAQQLLVTLGLGSPLARGVFGTLLGYGALWLIKPEFAFDPDSKQPKQWSQVAEPDAPQTALPWWIAGLFPGVFLGVFI